MPQPCCSAFFLMVFVSEGLKDLASLVFNKRHVTFSHPKPQSYYGTFSCQAFCPIKTQWRFIFCCWWWTIRQILLEGKKNYVVNGDLNHSCCDVTIRSRLPLNDVRGYSCEVYHSLLMKDGTDYISLFRSSYSIDITLRDGIKCGYAIIWMMLVAKDMKNMTSLLFRSLTLHVLLTHILWPTPILCLP